MRTPPLAALRFPRSLFRDRDGDAGQVVLARGDELRRHGLFVKVSMAMSSVVVPPSCSCQPAAFISVAVELDHLIRARWGSGHHRIARLDLVGGVGNMGSSEDAVLHSPAAECQWAC